MQTAVLKGLTCGALRRGQAAGGTQPPAYQPLVAGTAQTRSWADLVQAQGPVMPQSRVNRTGKAEEPGSVLAKRLFSVEACAWLGKTGQVHIRGRPRTGTGPVQPQSRVGTGLGRQQLGQAALC